MKLSNIKAISRLGTMANLAIIVLLAIIDTSSNQKVYEKLNFSGFIVKAVESHFAWFCS